MTRDEFRNLFLRALNAAAELAEERLAKPVPRSFTIELHPPGLEGRTVSVDSALDQIYLGENRFFRIIDVAIRRILPRKCVAFVRVSGHPSTAFSRTWDPSNLGPFKQIIAETIEDQTSCAMPENDASSILDEIHYATDFRVLLGDIRDFIDLSERTLEWQYRTEVQSIRRSLPLVLAELGHRYGTLLSEHRSENAEHRFKLSLPTRVRYAALISLVTAVEWYAAKLKEWAKFDIKNSKPDSIIKAFCKELSIDGSEVLQNFSYLREIRDEIAHGAGIRRSASRSGKPDLAEMVKALKGFRVVDWPFLGECVAIDRGALDAHIDGLEKLLVELVRTADERHLLRG